MHLSTCYFARAQPSLSDFPLNAFCGLFRNSKISEILNLSERLKDSKSSEIFEIGGASKYLGDFGSFGARRLPPERASA